MKALASILRSGFWTAALVFQLSGATVAVGQEVIIARGSMWHYWDRGVFPGAGWNLVGGADDPWPAGPGLLGYGDGDEATVVGYGPASTNKYLTTWFRRDITVSDPSAVGGLRFELVRDDGAAVYLNGFEVIRDNLPSGVLTESTRALTAVGGAAERAPAIYLIPAERLVPGVNVVAVEVHQSGPTSTDLAFDLGLTLEWRPFEVEPLFVGASLRGERGAVGLGVAAADPTGQATEAVLKFEVRPAPGPAGPDFTVVVLPDTQNYTAGLNGGKAAIFAAQADWIVGQRTARNIAFVTHVGDVVEHGDNGGTNTEWLVARDVFGRLENPVTTGLPDGLPLGIAVGNHDQTPNGAAGGATYFYNLFFGTNRFMGRSYSLGHFGGNNDNHVERFTAGGGSWLVLHLEYGAESDAAVMAWAVSVLRAHPDHRVIVSAHSIINAGSPGAFTAGGRMLYDGLKAEPNLVLMLCGHAVGEGRREDVFAGRTVYTLMADYQDRAAGGNGWLRLLEFSPSNNVVRVRTYSPWLDQFEADADSAFDLAMELAPGGPWADVGALRCILPASRAEVRCEGVDSTALYQCRVRVESGARTTQAGPWLFTTGDVGTPDPAEAGLSIARGGDGGLELRWSSVPGRSYRVCGKDDLAESDWTDRSADGLAVLRRMRWVIPEPRGPTGFFRVREMENVSPSAPPPSR